jgi:REP element-mobilizing transposase RayT
MAAAALYRFTQSCPADSILLVPIDFQPYNPDKPVRRYYRNLPHWRQEGATYFVTFRLYDSLPQNLVRYLDQLRNALLRAKDQTDSWLEADRAYFRKMKHYLTAGHGACWLKREDVKRIFESALRFFDDERYELGECAIMPNHGHFLIRPVGSHELEDILRGWKSFSAREMNQVLNRTGKVFQEESYDRLVRDSEEYVRTIRYIRNNPLPPEKREPG